MKMIKTAIAAGLLLGVTGAFADGAALFTSKICVTCHGADGAAPIMPLYPKLAGQSADYCKEQTKAIRDGARASGMAAAMKGAVAAVTDEEFGEICDWLATK